MHGIPDDETHLFQREAAAMDAEQTTTLDWKPGPSNGGEGTAGGDRWWDGDTLLVIVELKDGSREIFVANIRADEGRADMVLNGSGDDTGWQLGDIDWYAKLDSNLPPQQPSAAQVDHYEPRAKTPTPER